MTVSIIDPDAGGGHDYTDIRLWSNADRDLVTATDTEEGEIRPTSGSPCTVTNDELEWNGYTTNDTYYVEMRAHADHKHSGKIEASPSHARVAIDSTTGFHRILLRGAINIRDLELTREGVSGGDYVVAIWSGIADTRIVERCLIHAPQATERVDHLIGEIQSGDISNVYIINNVLTGYADRGIDFQFNGAHVDGAVYNNTIQHDGDTHECIAYNESSTYRRPDTKNNLLENQGAAGDYAQGNITLITTASNYTSDATSPDGAGFQNATATYEDQANFDLHLASGDDGNFGGTDLSADGTYSFSDDIDGDTRSDWDAGADEYIAAGGGVTVSLSGVSSTSGVGSLASLGSAVVPLSGVSTTSQIGSLVSQGSALLSLTGNEATGQIGILTALGGATLQLTGNQATGQVGTLTINTTGGVTLTLSGVSATGQAGDITVTTTGGQTIVLTGVQANGQIGTLSIVGGAVVSVTGNQATGQVGTLTAAEHRTLQLSGVEASAIVGVLDVTGSADVAISGVSTTGQLGTLTVDTGITDITIPGYRIMTIEAEDRTLLVLAEDRTLH